MRARQKGGHSRRPSCDVHGDGGTPASQVARTAWQVCRQEYRAWSIDGSRVGGVCAIGRRAHAAGLHRIERCEGSLFSGGERSRLSALQLWRQGHVVGVMLPARWTGSRFAGSTASRFSKIGIAGVLARGQWENGKGMEVPMLARHDGIHPAILAPDKLP